ncbi:hypothetical protein L248_1763 [Schleiferilactobacillus shenzhenensis LY-73]|uniref:Uncharacterized protein n=1 Tax=Schleiferilactobacillus shenzhenensis LY-73 TaxID=1231336 RepID=U4TPY0_9LACO|nr:hypothetical protein L248_1763 [Schleiferilactobacillus shenzhenensis LY-73]
MCTQNCHVSFLTGYIDLPLTVAPPARGIGLERRGHDFEPMQRAHCLKARPCCRRQSRQQQFHG